MDDDGLTGADLIEAIRPGNMVPDRDFVERRADELRALCDLALRALESRSEVLTNKRFAKEQAERIFNSAEAQCFRWLVKHHSGSDGKRCFIGGVDFSGDDIHIAILDAIDREESPRAEPGVPDDDHFNCGAEGKPCQRWCGANPCLVEHEPNAAEQASPSVAPADSNLEFAAGPASAAPEPAPQEWIDNRGNIRVAAAAHDVKGMVERLRGRGRELAGSTLITGQDDAHRMFAAAALLESAHARVDPWPAFTSFYNQGLEEAAKVVDKRADAAQRSVAPQHTGDDEIRPSETNTMSTFLRNTAAAIRAKIKPARGE